MTRARLGALPGQPPRPCRDQRGRCSSSGLSVRPGRSLTVPAVLALQRQAGNQAASGLLQMRPPGERSAGQAQAEVEKRMTAIISSLKPPANATTTSVDSGAYETAVRESLKAFLKTDTGKAWMEKVKAAATGKRGLPFTIMVLTQAAVAAVASNIEVPSLPDIDIAEGLSVSIKVEGTTRRPTGGMITLTWKFGGSSGSGAETRPAVAGVPQRLPAASETAIQGLEADLLYRALLRQAFLDYEIAGPDEEPRERREYLSLKADDGDVPEARAVARAVARKMLASAGTREVDVNLGLVPPAGWVSSRATFIVALYKLVTAVVSSLPASAETVRVVRFTLRDAHDKPLPSIPVVLR
jgi:hypothetical protein